MKKIILVLTILLINNLLLSQENFQKCKTTSLMLDEFKKNESYFNVIKSRKIPEKKYLKTTITIPIVIHVIHRNTHLSIGSGTNISDEQIEDQIRILNEDFSQTNPEFPNPPRSTFINTAGNPNLQFCLATTDPNGNPTNGITRTSTTKINWDADDNSNSICHEANAMKKTSCGGKDGWDPSRYLNIWVCDLTNSQSNGMTLGYAYLPGLLADFDPSNDYKDGLVVDYRYFGSNGIATNTSDGRTATHEIGHYLGLMHTFCEETDNQGNWICCDNDNNFLGGFVDDTPAAKDIYFGIVSSNTNNNSCNDISYNNIYNTDVMDMDENFMAYSFNTWMFSQSQVDAMISTLNTQDWLAGRLNLKNSNVSRNCSGLISNTVSINKNYPSFNISNGYLYVNYRSNIENLIILDVLGKIVYEIKKPDNLVNLNQLNNGVYFIKTSIAKQQFTIKIHLVK